MALDSVFGLCERHRCFGCRRPGAWLCLECRAGVTGAPGDGPIPGIDRHHVPWRYDGVRARSRSCAQASSSASRGRTPRRGGSRTRSAEREPGLGRHLGPGAEAGSSAARVRSRRADRSARGGTSRASEGRSTGAGFGTARPSRSRAQPALGKPGRSLHHQPVQSPRGHARR